MQRRRPWMRSLASFMFVVVTISQCVLPAESLLHRPRSVKLVEVKDKQNKTVDVPDKTFTDIYSQGAWGSGANDGMGSGSGSSMENTALLRQSLSTFIHKNSIHEMYDVPCGMMHWTMPFLQGIWQSDKSFSYIGMDIATNVVKTLNQTIKDPRVRVLHRDVTEGVLEVNVRDPEHSMVMTRQMLQHLSNEHACQALRNFVRIPAKYLLLDYHTGPKSSQGDIVSGGFRKINLRLPPFNLPAPHLVLDDDPAFPRQMFVYKLSELKHMKICGI